ncbi:protein of unknown function [Trichococcus flocculiformis]|uniref:DUF4430 domain-containing protein n=1 Tax=Trichococcus TaxID=82802 RepID=UPI0007A7F026|nr:MULTISPECIES: DUF4430 domain-containing protein [Trichococcus]CZR08920.1 Hypothetical protein TES5_2626 [Trichococcus sp. ES5]SHG08940.1 protein of unknown function [Trichococcus flocculiformis]
MKKYLALLAAGFILTGCGVSDSDTQVTETSSAVSSSVAEETVAVTIHVSVDGEEIEGGTKEVEVEPGAILLDVMKENYEIVEKDTFIESINGHEQDVEASKYWLFDLNGEMAPAGANDTELQEGDVVEWKLEPLS